jgi:hypothetical protein
LSGSATDYQSSLIAISARRCGSISIAKVGPPLAPYSVLTIPVSAQKRRLKMLSSTLIGILITFLVVVLILWLVQRLPVEARFRQILQIIVIVLGIISLLKYLAVF